MGEARGPGSGEVDVFRGVGFASGGGHRRLAVEADMFATPGARHPAGYTERATRDVRRARPWRSSRVFPLRGMPRSVTISAWGDGGTRRGERGHLPYGHIQLLVLDGLDIEADGRDGVDVLVQAELVLRGNDHDGIGRGGTGGRPARSGRMPATKIRRRGGDLVQTDAMPRATPGSGSPPGPSNRVWATGAMMHSTDGVGSHVAEPVPDAMSLHCPCIAVSRSSTQARQGCREPCEALRLAPALSGWVESISRPEQIGLYRRASAACGGARREVISDSKAVEADTRAGPSRIEGTSWASRERRSRVRRAPCIGYKGRILEWMCTLVHVQRYVVPR